MSDSIASYLELVRETMVLDAHAHLVDAVSYSAHFPESTPGKMIDGMAAAEVDFACISGIGSGIQNHNVAAAVRMYPEKLVGFAQYNPRYEDSGAVLEALIESKEFAGIGEVHPTSYTHDYPIDGPNYEPMWLIAEQHSLPVLVHSGPQEEYDRCSPLAIANMAKKYSGCTVLLGHCGAYGRDPWPLLQEAIEVTKRTENVILDLCGTARHFGIVESVIAAVGDERVVFGSDAAFHGWANELGHVAFADISYESKRRVLGANMARILEMALPPGKA